MGVGPSSWGTQSDRVDRVYLAGRTVLLAAIALGALVTWAVFLWVWWYFTDLMAFDEPGGERDPIFLVAGVVVSTAVAALVVVATSRAAVRNMRAARRVGVGRDLPVAP